MIYLIKLKSLIISLIIPLAVGLVAGALTRNNIPLYNMIIQPKLSPPGAVFPIIWPVLYILMGVSCYIIYESQSELKNTALTLYAVQLVINFLWSIIFFNLQLYLAAFVFAFALLCLVVAMVAVFLKINKVAGLLQIPYIIWLVYANYLSFGVYLLN